jgi:predicted DNA-binding protein
MPCNHDTTVDRWLRYRATTWHYGFVKPTKAMTLRLSPEQAEELETIAGVENLPVAEVVRAAITRHIEETRNDEGFRQGLRARIERAEKLLQEP